MARLSCDIARGVDRARSPSSFRWPSPRNRPRRRRKRTSPRSSRSPETSGRGTTTTFSRPGKRESCSTGTEVKSLRDGRANISDAYGIITDGEVFLLNLHISQYERGGYTNHEPARTRKLLLHRKEIRRLIGAVERQGLTLVPLELYFKNGVAKVALALGKGKKLHDKRDTERTRDAEREMARVVRSR